MNLLDRDLSIPGGDFLTHLDDTYEGAGEHDDLVIAAALACLVGEPLPYVERPDVADLGAAAYGGAVKSKTMSGSLGTC